MIPEIAAASRRFRSSHRGSWAFYDDKRSICYRVEGTYAGVMGLPFNRERAQFIRENSVYAGFYKTSLTVDIQVSDRRSADQREAQAELQALLNAKKERGELDNVTVLVKNPVKEAPMFWNIQNMLVEIDGEIFVATRHGEIVRPLTDTARGGQPDKTEAYVAAEFLKRKAEINEANLDRWDTQQCVPVSAAQN